MFIFAIYGMEQVRLIVVVKDIKSSHALLSAGTHHGIFELETVHSDHEDMWYTPLHLHAYCYKV